MTLEQAASSRPENLYVSYRRKGYTMESQIMLKTGRQKKLYPPTRCQRPAAVSPTTTFGRV